MEVIKQSSNYVVEHGEYIFDWQDEKGHIFEQVMVITDGMVELMLREAIAGFITEESVTELTDGFKSRSKDRDPFLYLTKMEETKPQHWHKVPNKGFVITQVGYRSCVGIYRHDFTNYLIKAEPERVLAFMKSRFYPNELLAAVLAMAGYR